MLFMGYLKIRMYEAGMHNNGSVIYVYLKCSFVYFVCSCVVFNIERAVEFLEYAQILFAKQVVVQCESLFFLNVQLLINFHINTK